MAQVILLLAILLSQQDTTVLKPEEARKMLYRHLEAEAKTRFDDRRKEVSAINTPEALQARQKRLREKFVEALGGFPERTPINSRIVGRINGEGFRVEKVIYESRTDHHVTAVLYLPDGAGPFPGVLVPCGHSVTGKAEVAYQRACILMAKNGIAVLCYDPIGQGERVQLLDGNGKPAISGSTTEHTMAGIGALLVGRCTASYRIWDGIRSIDYLASRPEIDPKRLGCTGNSGGGTLTAYLMALDDRIVAAAPSCYITTLERLFATIGPQDAEQNIPGQVAFGMDHADYVTMRAPRPTLICVGTQDYFDIDGAWTTYREAKRLYGVLGFGERVDLFEYNDKHGFSKPRREAAMRWMRRWLLDKNDAPIEEDFPVFKPAELQCTTSGQVLADLKGKSVFDLNAERAKELAVSRGECDLKKVRQLLGLPEYIRDAVFKNPVKVKRESYWFEKLTLQVPGAPGIELPALRFWHEKTNQYSPAILYVSDQGFAKDPGLWDRLEKWLEAGRQVFAVDLRGMGETCPAVPDPKQPNPLGLDWREFFLSSHLNRPLLGQRVQDLISVVSFMVDSCHLRDGIHVIATGAAGPPALHAAALYKNITELTLERSIASWSAVAAAPLTKNQLTNVVPGALLHYDLPDLAAAIAPRKLTIRDPVDPMGNPIKK